MLNKTAKSKNMTIMKNYFQNKQMNPRSFKLMMLRVMMVMIYLNLNIKAMLEMICLKALKKLDFLQTKGLFCA